MRKNIDNFRMLKAIQPWLSEGIVYPHCALWVLAEKLNDSKMLSNAICEEGIRLREARDFKDAGANAPTPPRAVTRCRGRRGPLPSRILSPFAIATALPAFRQLLVSVWPAVTDHQSLS